MKLIFLGDSFTEGLGIDIEYGLKEKILDGDSFFIDRKKIDPEKFSIIFNFKRDNVWTKLLCNEINFQHENFAVAGSGGDLLFLQLLESEKKNKNIKRFYIICLPKLSQGRIMISNEKNFSIKNLLYFFYCVVVNHLIKDIDFYKKYFDKNFFYMYYLNFLMSIINYLKNKKVGFLFLPTWEPTIEKHFFNEQRIRKKEQTLFNYYERFFFNELKDQMNFKINHNDLTFLPCGHADIKSQYLIKDIYKNYILEKVK